MHLLLFAPVIALAFFELVVPARSAIVCDWTDQRINQAADRCANKTQSVQERNVSLTGHHPVRRRGYLLTNNDYDNLISRSNAAEGIKVTEANIPGSLSFETAEAILREQHRWSPLPNEDILEVLFLGTALYGTRQDPSLIDPLSSFIRYADGRTSTAQRSAVVDRLVQYIDSGKTSASALLPVIFVETNNRSVSTAALSYAILAQSSNADPVGPAKQIMRWFHDRAVNNRAAVFGGLLASGDPRILNLLKSLRSELSEAELRAVVEAYPDFANLNTLEWWIEWMEQSPGGTDDVIFGQAGIALYDLVVKSRTPFFVSGLRPLGQGPTGGKPLPASDSSKVYSSKDVGELFQSRLYALEAKEAPPKLMSDILLHYGLKPRARINERFVPKQREPYRSAEFLWLKVTFGLPNAFSDKFRDGFAMNSSEHDNGKIGEMWRSEINSAHKISEQVRQVISSTTTIPGDQLFTSGAFMTIKDAKWHPTIFYRIQRSMQNETVVGKLRESKDLEKQAIAKMNGIAGTRSITIEPLATP